MKAIKYLICVFLLLNSFQIFPQDQSILIFDPNGASSSFQSTLAQLTDDTVFVADTLDDAIFNYDAAFLFINYPYILSEEESNRLIQYTSGNMPAYIFTGILPAELDSIAFWNHIGVDDWSGLLLSVPIDTVFGVHGEFTNGIVIDTSFMSILIPVIIGNVDSILIGTAQGWEVNTTYKSGYDSLNVIIDLYNLIYDYGFLERVLQKFNLVPPPLNVQIQFFPPVDTALIQGGCTTPEFICKNLISTNERDSISIEPGFNSYFYYLDSLGYPIQLDNFYFIVIDSLDEFEYEVWFHPKSYPPFDPVLVEFDSLFYSEQNNFNLQLIVKKQGIQIAEFTQPFHADFGLGVEDNGKIPGTFNLSQNYPNPFNSSTVINYQLPVTSNVTLIVYDVLGNEIATLVSEEKQPGVYEVEFSPESSIKYPASGIYFYQLKAGNYIETKKMILLK